MASRKNSVKMPATTREAGERNLDLPTWLTRYVPPWITPDWIEAEIWRRVVRNQPVSMICRDTLISNLNALDWKIQARDSNERDELKDDVEYYTKGLEYEFGIDFADHIEWIGQDLLDLPFGSASEIGREGDEPEGKVIWIDLLDGATLFPTANVDVPVGQRLAEVLDGPVFFPKHSINRIMMSPRPEIKRKGWGMAPPEKVYLAFEALARGDKYWANMLLDTPEAGILDLIDMEKESAEQWLHSYRELLTGIDPFKIPVLYEHEKKAEWIPFTQPPTALMFDKISLKQAAIVAAGYGMSLSDIGINLSESGGDTMAGTISQERKTRRTGFAVLKKKTNAYFNRILPRKLEFSWIDYDEEQNVARGRARLGNATAFSQLITSRIFTPQEARSQMIRDGDVTVPVPETVPEGEFPEPVLPGGGSPERPGLMGYPKPPSTGGYGEVKQSRAATNSLEQNLKLAFDQFVQNADSVRIEKLIRIAAKSVFPEVQQVLQELSETEDIELWQKWHSDIIWGKSEVEVPEFVQKSITNTYKSLDDEDFDQEDWWQMSLDEEAVIVALSLAYLESLRSSASELLSELYVSGYLQSPELPNVVFSLENPIILSYLQERAAAMVRNVNDGTRYYLRRILLSSVRDGLTEEAIIARIRAGIDINEIMQDNTFMQKLSQVVEQEIRELSNTRIRAIVSYELGSVVNQARLDQFKRAGLTRKLWIHEGDDDPCIEFCEGNIRAGYVDLDYEYSGAFGPTKSGPSHPHDHCHVGYDRGELYSAMSRGQFTIWHGQ